MALAFNKSKGKAKKSSMDQYQYKDGDNTVRLVGGLLPRYLYWVEGYNGKNIPFECLAFDREEEAFNNKEKDWVQETYPDLKCGWAYSILCIDPKDNKVKVLNLKKKLTEQVMVLAEDLGDPTDPETGWSICFKKIKTGSMAYNVEYQLQQIKCQKAVAPLTAKEKAAVAASETIDQLIPRPSAEAQKAALDRIISKISEEGEDAVDATVENEFDIK